MIGIVLTSHTKIFFSCDNFAVDSFVLNILEIKKIENFFLVPKFRLTLSSNQPKGPLNQHAVVQTFAMMSMVAL